MESSLRHELMTMILLIREEYRCPVQKYPEYIWNIFNKRISLQDIYNLLYDYEEDYERESRMIECYT